MRRICDNLILKLNYYCSLVSSSVVRRFFAVAAVVHFCRINPNRKYYYFFGLLARSLVRWFVHQHLFFMRYELCVLLPMAKRSA